MLDSGSDSDSDLEFLAAQASPRVAAPAPGPPRAPGPASTRAGPGASSGGAAASAAASSSSSGSSSTNADAASSLQAQIEALRREMWEKLGENVILRAQLDSNVRAHERELGNLINQQAKAKEDMRLELDRQRKQAEKERVQMQFLQAELRARAGARPAAAASVAPSAAPASSAPASPSKRRPAAALSDGFVLKKQRILPSFDASLDASQASQLGAAAPPAAGDALAASRAASREADLRTLLALVAAHRAPGQRATTLELLFALRVPSGESLGQRVSTFASYEELVDTVLELAAARALDDDGAPLLLALLYALVLRRWPLDGAHARAVPQALCAALQQWLKHLGALPPFAALLPPFSLPLRELRRLTCVLYALDVLAALDVAFAVPPDLSRRLLTCAHAPQIVAKTVALLCLQPASVTSELAQLVNATPSVRPSIELLFTGLADVPCVNVAQLCRDVPPSQTTCSLARSLSALAELRQRAEHRAAALGVTLRSACVQLALALQYDRPAPLSMYAQVLAVLTGSIDRPVAAGSRVVQECVLFFWCAEPAHLRDALSEDELAELEVCLAKLVCAATSASDTIERGRQLLQALASGVDSDLVFEAFEPPGHEPHALTHEPSATAQ